jgi:hypothetical protein
MIKRIALTLVLGVMGAGLMVVPAQAASDQDVATVSLSINQSIDITLTPTFQDFGAVNPGTTDTANDVLGYDVTTNALAGFKVELTTTNAGPAGMFSLRGSGSFTAVPAATSTAFGGIWRTQNAPGTFTYTDDVQYVTSANQAPGNYSRTIRYTATTL